MNDILVREKLADALHRAICERRGELVGHTRDMDIVLAERIIAELKVLTK